MAGKAPAFGYRVTTLGCRVNRAESLALSLRMEAAGGFHAEEGRMPEVWVVNTCAVTAEAMRKSRKAVRRSVASGAGVTVTGCASQLEPATFEEMAGPGSVVPNSAKDSMFDGGLKGAAVAGGRRALPAVDAVRVPLKVQDGCERFCTYCIVPHLRGPLSSRSVDSIAEEARELEERGAGEIVLCGIDLGSYRDPVSGEGLAFLVGRLLGEPRMAWIRLSSLELSDVSDDLLSLMYRHEGLCPHLHIPLQSGDARVLEDMGREYGPERFAGRVSEIRSELPNVAVTTDVMVGFPTETEGAFERTRAFLEGTGFRRVHVFKYSPRPLTAALALGDPVDLRTKEARAAALRRLAAGMTARFNGDLNGRIIPVLVEATMKSRRGSLFGRARNYGGVIFDGGPELVGRFVNVRVNGPGADGMHGELVPGADSGREGGIN